jgi:aminocarboxymuconate-semialdehyde decarboxylase
MLINLHAHHLSHGMFGKHPHWGPLWENNTLKIGNWVLGTTARPGVDVNAEHPAERRRLERRLQVMEERGIDKIVLSNPAHLFMYWAGDWGTQWARIVNDELSEYCAQLPDRLYFWALVPMGDPREAVRELDRAVNELGAVGMYMGGANMGEGREVYDPAFYPLWEKVVELGVPVFVHGYNQTAAEDTSDDPFDTSSIVGMNFDETRCIWYLINGGVLDRYPDLRFYVTHAGGFFPYHMGRFEQTNITMAPDSRNIKKVSEYLDNFYFDPDVHEPIMRRALVELIGVDKFVYGDNLGGSDNFEGDLTEGIGLSSEDREKIRSGNALRLIPKLGAA